jgi:DHA1 family inner membrane transport protein
MNPRIFVLALSTFSFGSGAFIFAGLLEHVARDLGVDTGTAGQLQTAYVLTSALAGPPLAMLMGRRDRKQVLMIALAAAFALNVLCMAVNGFSQLLIIRAMIGALAALAGPAASSAASALVPPQQRGSALAIVTGGMTIAFLMGIPMGSVVGDFFGWRATFTLAAGLSLTALVAVTFLLPSITPPPPLAGQRAPMLPLLPLYATTFLAFGANMTISTYIAPIIRLQTGITGAGVGAFQIMVGLGSFLGLTLGARAANTGKGGLSVSLAFVALACAAALHHTELMGGAPEGIPTYIVVALAFLTASTALFSIMPVIQTRLIAAAPEAAPLALAFNGSSASFGQALGGALGGAMLSNFGAPAITVAAGTLALTALLVWRGFAARPVLAHAAG